MFPDELLRHPTQEKHQGLMLLHNLAIPFSMITFFKSSNSAWRLDIPEEILFDEILISFLVFCVEDWLLLTIVVDFLSLCLSRIIAE